MWNIRGSTRPQSRSNPPTSAVHVPWVLVVAQPEHQRGAGRGDRCRHPGGRRARRAVARWVHVPHRRDGDDAGRGRPTQRPCSGPPCGSAEPAVRARRAPARSPPFTAVVLAVVLAVVVVTAAQPDTAADRPRVSATPAASRRPGRGRAVIANLREAPVRPGPRPSMLARPLPAPCGFPTSRRAAVGPAIGASAGPAPPAPAPQGPGALQRADAAWAAQAGRRVVPLGAGAEVVAAAVAVAATDDVLEPAAVGVDAPRAVEPGGVAGACRSCRRRAARTGWCHRRRPSRCRRRGRRCRRRPGRSPGRRRRRRRTWCASSQLRSCLPGRLGDVRRAAAAGALPHASRPSRGCRSWLSVVPPTAMALPQTAGNDAAWNPSSPDDATIATPGWV